MLPTSAYAQDGQDARAQSSDDATILDGSGQQVAGAGAGDMIVVTGTQVRGAPAPGTNVVTISEEDVEATGATSVAQLLQTTPQLGSFGQLQTPLANSQEVSVNRPNLRNLPGFNTAGGSGTLVLLDGHRVVGMGNASTSPDPDIIPPGVIERLEIVPDGGSAVYGSDAVAGVLNFVTIKEFDGLEVDGSFGFADDYYRWDTNMTAGRAWDGGSIFLSYNYAESDELLGRDRDYIREFPNSAGFTSLGCEPGNITNSQNPSQVTGVNGGAINQCDVSDFASVYPSSQRHSVFAGLTQDLSDSLTFELRGFYTNRDTQIQGGPYRPSLRVGPNIPGIAVSSPYAPPGSPNRPYGVNQVDFQIGSSNAANTEVELDTWGITPTITADLDGNFQLRVLGSYGESTSNFRGDSINQTALDNAVRAGFINPFDPTDPATNNSDAVDQVTNFQQFGRTRQYLTNARATIDGDLFELPAGFVKVAAGVEYLKEEFVTQNGQAVPGFENSGFSGSAVNGTPIMPAIAPVPEFDVDRNVKSVFGEIIIPVLETDSGVELSLSAAGRYDDYSDVGDTFNPRFGATFKPTDWITLRGAWGESFNAPSLADNENASATTVFVLTGQQANFFAPPASVGGYPPYPPGQNIIAVRGNAPGITPQEATTWTLGFDIQPPFVPGLDFGLTYYNIDFTNLIGLAPFQDPGRLYADYGFLVDTTPTQAEIDGFLNDADIINGPTSSPEANTYAILDARKRNLGSAKLDGLDMRLSYQRSTGFGTIYFNTNGTYELGRELSPVPGAPFVEQVDANVPRLRVRSTLGAEVGQLLGQISWNHTSGYDWDPPVGFAGTTLGGETFTLQDEIDAFDTFDLYFRYEFGGDGAVTRDLALTLNVENVFAADPPEYRGGSQVAGQNGIPSSGTNTLGRLVQFGVSKKF